MNFAAGLLTPVTWLVTTHHRPHTTQSRAIPAVRCIGSSVCWGIVTPKPDQYVATRKHKVSPCNVHISTTVCMNNPTQTVRPWWRQLRGLRFTSFRESGLCTVSCTARAVCSLMCDNEDDGRSAKHPLARRILAQTWVPLCFVSAVSLSVTCRQPIDKRNN